jgi:hypothetical protein
VVDSARWLKITCGVRLSKKKGRKREKEKEGRAAALTRPAADSTRRVGRRARGRCWAGWAENGPVDQVAVSPFFS